MKLKNINRRLLQMVQVLIQAYGAVISPDHGIFKRCFPAGVCRYSPTCSCFSQEALGRYGWWGLALALHRVLRCHPWAKGGYDPVPKRLY